jgi:RNA polymerase sigma-70 factor (ECF subfamily)
VNNKLLEVTRHHLGTRMRDAKRERPIDVPRAPDETSAALCAHLTAGLTRPSVAAARGEVHTRLAEALSAMDPTDREVLALRHFEQLTSAEAAQVLGIHVHDARNEGDVDVELVAFFLTPQGTPIRIDAPAP